MTEKETDQTKSKGKVVARLVRKPKIKAIARLVPITTIKVSVETKEALKALGKMGDTYEDVIKKLIKSYRERGNVR